MSAYADLLKDPRWQKKRLEILERDGWTCLHCDAKDKTLHINHRRYDWGKKPWEYDSSVLETLCVDCHALIGDVQKKVKAAFKDAQEFVDPWTMLGHLHGVVMAEFPNTTERVLTYEHAAGIGAAFGLDGNAVVAALSNAYTIDGWTLDKLRTAVREAAIAARKKRR